MSPSEIGREEGKGQIGHIVAKWTSRLKRSGTSGGQLSVIDRAITRSPLPDHVTRPRCEKGIEQGPQINWIARMALVLGFSNKSVQRPEISLKMTAKCHLRCLLSADFWYSHKSSRISQAQIGIISPKRLMMTASKHIRTLYAYTLLCVMALQWLAGSMYMKMTYLIETPSEMSEVEQTIANDVMDQFGFAVQVNLVDASDMNFINGLGYAAPFVHTLEVEGSMNSFTLTKPELQYQHVEFVIKNRDGMQPEQKNKICLEKLFSQFCFGESEFSKNDNNSIFTQHNFAVISLCHIFDHSAPSPPPKLA